jgi:hypothetical protein
MLANARDRDEYFAIARQASIDRDSLRQLFLDRTTCFFQGRSEVATGIDDHLVHHLSEPSLLHAEKFDQLSAASRQGLQDQLIGVGDWAKVLAHLVSKARDEGGVQPVGLGDRPLASRNALMRRGLTTKT